MPKTAQDRAILRKIRTRSQIFGLPDRPRLSVYRSLHHVYAQVIDDSKGRTLAFASTRGDELKSLKKKSNQEAAAAVGEAVAKKAIQAGIKKVVFDRGSKIYHGRVKAVAEAARKAGLEF